MIATWTVELFLDKLNILEDSIANSGTEVILHNIQVEMDSIRKEFERFIIKHKVYIYTISHSLLEGSRSTDNLRSN